MGIQKLDQRGVSLIELMIAVGIMVAMAGAVVLARSYMAKQTQRTSDKIFATQKAIQIFEELKSAAAVGGGQGVMTLDNYNDGTAYKNILTTDPNVTSPSDALSANKTANGYWKFWRQVEILHVPQDAFARIISVKVFGGLQGNKADTQNLLAEVGGLVGTNNQPVPPTQVYDVYELALSNELGWFTTIPNMDVAFGAAITAVETLNPGLQFRKHLISQTAFGRDSFYTPYLNQALDTTVSVMPWIYFYTGLTPQTSGGGDAMFFDPTQLEKVGGINVDNGTPANDNGYSMCDMYNTAMRYPDELAAYNAVSQTWASNPANTTPYQMTLRMLLEQMNSQPASLLNPLLISMHGEVLPLVNMRNYSDAAKDPLNASGLTGITPIAGRNIRVVTHPDLIHYPSLSGSRSVSLRVYAYYDGLLNPSNLNTSYPMSPNTPVAPLITLYFPGINLKANDVNITAIVGGYAAGLPVSYQAVNLPTTNVSQMGMSWGIGNPGLNTNDTAITLYNTPLRCGAIAIAGAGGSTTGLDSSQLLYNAEYIPCAPTTAQNYSQSLTLNRASAMPVNTARWVISFKTHGGSSSNVPDGQYAVETRLGADLTTGNYPPTANTKYVTLMSDLSRTYLWIGTGSNAGTTFGGSGVTPFTERFQYNGDPRHEPYLDCKFGSVSLGTADSGTTIDADSYNWYFENVNADGYSGFSMATSGYNGYGQQSSGTVTFGDMRDLPRYWYTYRRGLLQTTGIYTNINGYTSFHASEGGEMGGTYNPYSNSLIYKRTPWDPTSATTVSIDEVQPTNNWNPSYLSAGTTWSCARDVMYNSSQSVNPVTVWYAKWWEGEMYPDSVTISGGTTIHDYAAIWVGNGNLPTTQFWRVPFESISAGGTTNGFDSRHVQWGVGYRAPGDFMNGIASGAGSSTIGFACDVSNAASTVTNLGLNLYNITNFFLDSPLTGSQRPWSCYFNLPADPTKMPVTWAWNSNYYTNLRTTLSVPNVSSVPRVIYTSGDTNGNLWGSAPVNTYEALGTVEMDYSPASGTTQTCYYNLSGLAPQGNTGAQILAQTGLNSMIRAYLDAGLIHPAGQNGHISQLPLFQLSSGNAANQFTNPSAVTVSWTSPVTGASSAGGANDMWFRWAGFANGANFYTEEYPGYSSTTLIGSTYTEPSSITLYYVPMWSVNGQPPWISAIDNATTMTTGNYYVTCCYPTAGALAVTQQSVNWDVSNAVTFPEGNYSFRVDGFRQGFPLHYSYHEIDNIFFTR